MKVDTKKGPDIRHCPLTNHHAMSKDGKSKTCIRVCMVASLHALSMLIEPHPPFYMERGAQASKRGGKTYLLSLSSLSN